MLQHNPDDRNRGAYRIGDRLHDRK
jgi:hypothetical protein